MTARSRRDRAGAVPQFDDGSEAPVDPAILALAALLGEQLAAEEIARRAAQAAADQAADN